MKEALFYEMLENKKIQCNLCPHNCIILPGKRGNCRARENKDGKLVSLVYGKLVSANPDPIEKKPLYHFLPRTKAYSIATTGCNFHCLFCQNWEISQADAEDIPYAEMTPEQVVEEAIRTGCKSIAYTYIEPNVFYEFILDTAKIAKKRGLKNIMVTNGYLNPEPTKKLYKYIDAANIDLKGFTEEFYKKICKGKLEPVLDCIKQINKMNVHIELTNMIIPGFNDDMKTIKKMCLWIKENLGDDCPLHFSRFFPVYKMLDVEPTPIETLKKAYDTAKKAGLKYVYVGNVADDEHRNTFCPKCSSELIKRSYFAVIENKLKNGKCFNCAFNIKGVWS